jgi:type IV fimbrial biogenesis protein FimT
MLSLRAPQRGFNLTEVMITLSVLGVLLALGVPGFSDWLQNQQTRAAAEATLNGLQVARGEAVRRNAPVRFQLVSELTATCVLASDSLDTAVSVSWVVSLADPTGACDAKPGDWKPDDPPPQIIRVRSSAEDSPNAMAYSVFIPSPPDAPTPKAASTVTFGALGNVVANADGSLSINKIDMTNYQIGPDARRALRIVITAGGSTRLCDPAVPAADPRACPAFPS